MSKLGKILMAGALGSMAISGTAQAACWSPAAADAAHVRDLQSRLMVAALRCAKSGDDLLPDYNRFVRGKKSVISGSNNVLKAHFGKGKSRRNALNAYDRYAVSLANRYGAGSGDLSECGGMKRLASAAADSDGKLATLISIAQTNGLSPNLPGGRCGIVLASNTGQ